MIRGSVRLEINLKAQSGRRLKATELRLKREVLAFLGKR